MHSSQQLEKKLALKILAAPFCALLLLVKFHYLAKQAHLLKHRFVEA